MEPELRDRLKAAAKAHARDNRRRFLEPYKAEYDKLVEQKQAACDRYMKGDTKAITTDAIKEMRRIDQDIATLIVKLLKKEPSHLAEPWILWNVVSWMRRYDSTDFLKAAFIEETDRYRPTKGEIRRSHNDGLLEREISEIQAELGCGKKEACMELVNRQADEETTNPHLPQWDIDNQDHGLEEKLRKKMSGQNNAWDRDCAKAREHRKGLQFPYYGLDFDYHVDDDTLPPPTVLDPFDLYE